MARPILEELDYLLSRIDWAMDKGEKDLLESQKLHDIEQEIKSSLKQREALLGEDNQLRLKKLSSGWTNAPRSGFTNLGEAVKKLSPWYGLIQEIYKEKTGVTQTAETYIGTGKQYDGMKALVSILRLATTNIDIEDNYLHPDILSLLEPYIAATPSVTIRLLTKKQ